MRWALILGLLFSVRMAQAQVPESSPDAPPAIASPVTASTSAEPTSSSLSSPDDLPDAPSAVAQNQDVVVVGEAALKASGKSRPSCDAMRSMGFIYVDPKRAGEKPQPCSELVYPYQLFLDTKVVIPLTWQQKGYVALHNVADPGNLATIALTSGITIAVDPDSAYGPGLKGFGKNAGVSLLQNATVEFFGTFAVPSLMHQDPRYYRMPDRPFKQRLIYSISRTVISRHDDGSPMPNYGTLLEYPINAVISNLYVPGIESDGASTAKRILVGYALDPVNNILTEFLPDVAKHVRIRVIFIQRFLNNIAANPSGLP